MIGSGHDMLHARCDKVFPRNPIAPTIPLLKHLLSGIFAVLIFSAFSFLTSPASADDHLGSLEDLLPPSSSKSKARSFTGRIRIFNSVLLHPLPVWSRVANGPAPAEKTKLTTANRKGVYYLDMVPKDESFKQWTNRFGVVGFNQPNASLQRQSNLVVQHFRSICSPSNLQVFRGRQAADRTVIVVACGSYSRQPGTGQMAAVMFLKNKTQSVTMRREWRGPAFQSKVASTWPVPKRELDGVLSELYRSRLLALKKH